MMIRTPTPIKSGWTCSTSFSSNSSSSRMLECNSSCKSRCTKWAIILRRS
jgi:hypothetical protein